MESSKLEHQLKNSK